MTTDAPSGWRQYYEAALKAADDQVGKALAVLEAEGYLDNAVLVLLSDHGESFGLDEMPSASEDIDSAVSAFPYGHGTNLFAPAQNRILLAFRISGNGEFPPGPRAQTAATVDIAPTIAELAGLKEDGAGDGISLLPWLSQEQTAIRERQFFLETGFTPQALSKGELSVRAVVAEGAGYYHLHDNGRLVVKPEMVDIIVQGKGLGVTDSKMIIGGLPRGDGSRDWYLADLEKWSLAPLEGSGAADCDSRCRRLLRSLAQFYAGDLSANDHAAIGRIAEKSKRGISGINETVGANNGVASAVIATARP